MNYLEGKIPFMPFSYPLHLNILCGVYLKRYVVWPCKTLLNIKDRMNDVSDTLYVDQYRLVVPNPSYFQLRFLVWCRFLVDCTLTCLRKKINIHNSPYCSFQLFFLAECCIKVFQNATFHCFDRSSRVSPVQFGWVNTLPTNPFN